MICIKNIVVLILFFCLSAYSVQKVKKDDKSIIKTDSIAKPLPKKKKSFDDSLKSHRKFDGLFKFYQDTLKGTILMVIKKEQLNRKFIYFSYSENGPVSVQGFKGNYKDNKVFMIRKYYDRLEFVAINSSFYFDPTNPISKSADANISQSILFTKKILDTDAEKKEYLLSADDLFLTEALQRIKPAPPRGVPSDAYFSLGSLSREKSKLLKIRNYPKNTDLLVEYVFENQYPSVGGGGEVTDERNVSIQIQHSLIELPENNYKPRFDDQRIGYFTTQQNDMTSTNATNFHDFIHRWNLEKKDSLAEISEPKQPIVWWIENTTPIGLRETIKKAALTWNMAFEKAGFKNALVVNIQSDTATWDAGDIRYNVLRWTSSPNPIFGGYGPSFVNPLSGEILGADIMLEYVFITNRLKQEKLFDRLGNLEMNDHEHPNCAMIDHLHQSAMFGKLALNTSLVDSVATREYMRQSIYYLVLHELGHTLGLNHNMKASQMLTPEELNDVGKTDKYGLVGSVMDYPTVNICVDKTKQGLYFTDKPGPYDLWAIEYGYKQFSDSLVEKKGLAKILRRSTEPYLAFGNDADDMRSAGVHIDPRVMINDLSKQPIRYMTDRIKLVNSIALKLLARYPKEGDSYQELRNAYQMLTNEHSNAAAIISRYVGGVYVERNVANKKNASKPFAPVKLEDQKMAMSMIANYVFAPDAYNSFAGLYQYLQVQRRGFTMMGQNEDPKIHDRVLAIQKSVLDHWLHPNVLKRLTDSELYGNKYSNFMFLNELTEAIFKADINIKPNSFRQNLQIEYLTRLTAIAKLDMATYDHISRANINFQLRKIQKMLDANKTIDPSTSAHKQYLAQLIAKGLVVK